MNQHEFDAHMRTFETMGQVQVPADHYIVLRLDGKGFSKFTEKHFKKPYDKRFSDLMVATTMKLMEQFGAVYGYTESDEISLLLPRNFKQYNRELAKLVSISAAMAASVFTVELVKERVLGDIPFVAFDSRVWHSNEASKVSGYFRWRESDAVRCDLNNRAYWMLRQRGHTAYQATRKLDGQSRKFKTDLLRQNGVSYEKLPPYQRRGLGFYSETYMKTGFNPKLGLEVTVPRRRIKVDRNLPQGEAYSELLYEMVRRSDVVGTDQKYSF